MGCGPQEEQLSFSHKRAHLGTSQLRIPTICCREGLSSAAPGSCSCCHLSGPIASHIRPSKCPEYRLWRPSQTTFAWASHTDLGTSGLQGPKIPG